MNREKLSKILRNWRVALWLLLAFIAFLLLMNIIPVNSGRGIGFGNGIDYGMDFSGGIRLTLKLEKPVSQDVMNIERQILQDRLNGLGLKDMRILPLMDRYILIEVVNASAQDIKQIEDVIKRQAKFEARVDGQLAITGDELGVDLSPQGSGISRSQPPEWFVAIRNSIKGGERFCSVASGKIGRPIDMFLDRPEDAFILMQNSTFEILREKRDSYGDALTDLIEKRAVVPIVIANNGSINIKEILKLNKSKAIIAGDEKQISESIENLLQENNISVERKPKDEAMDDETWVKYLINLKSSPKLNCNPCSECKYSAQLTGTANTIEEARAEVKRNQILLNSGNLPEKVEIAKKSEISPAVGSTFLYYSFLIGILSCFLVAFIIFLKYRKLFIVTPIICVAISEIIMTLGLSTIIPVGGKLGWEIDLSAIAGIIAAVGTGVDDQIVITDETLREERERKIVSILERIKKAFFIIFTAASTVVVVMLPLFTIQELRGFAFTTILGIFIGIFITRPAYAQIIRELLEK
ncbi:MAG: hypothetical protein QW802_04460 [Candidatus Altiarchaeota archaeon]